MSSDVAIRCEGLSKRYRIGEQERYKALRDVIADTAAAPFRRLRSIVRSGNSANGNGSEIRNPQSALRNSHRSEEHTSELQSHLNLVCRLLLEKKKTTITSRRAL